MKALGENPTEDELQNLINKFDDDGTGLIEFTEFLCLMATQAKEREQEELEGFIPFCFKAFADNVGVSLKVKQPPNIYNSTYINVLFLLLRSQPSPLNISDLSCKVSQKEMI